MSVPCNFPPNTESLHQLSIDNEGIRWCWRMQRERERERERERCALSSLCSLSSENYFSPPPFLVKWRKCNLRRRLLPGRRTPPAEVTISRILGQIKLDWVREIERVYWSGEWESLEERLSCRMRILTVPNSFVVMVPSPSLSNREKASLNSAICSSVSWSA